MSVVLPNFINKVNDETHSCDEMDTEENPTVYFYDFVIMMAFHTQTDDCNPIEKDDTSNGITNKLENVGEYFWRWFFVDDLGFWHLIE